MECPHPDSTRARRGAYSATWGLLFSVILSGCVLGPRELDRWLGWHAEHPRRAVAWLCDRWPAECDPPEPSPWRPDTPCAQWAQLALEAGWTRDQWLEPVARIMWAESRCSPTAYNGASGVAGLMQIHPLWKADAECAGNLYDPLTNLRCARHVYAVQGWRAWVTY